MKCPKCFHRMEAKPSGDDYCPNCKKTFHRIGTAEIRIDKTKAETIDWLTNGLSDKALEREQKKWERRDARVEKRLDRQHSRRQKKIDKARKKYHISDCPRCGTKRPAFGFGITYHLYHIECQKCYFCGATSRMIRGAIKEWNKVCEELKRGENQ